MPGRKQSPNRLEALALSSSPALTPTTQAREPQSAPTKKPAKRGGVILTDALALGLFYIQRYRFLTIQQFARATGLHPVSATRQLRALQLHGLLGYFGGVAVPGYGGTPKAYYLTRKGWELLTRESGIPLDLLGTHKEVKTEAKWSPQMYHRLRTVDLMISAECAVRKRPHLSMITTFLEYKRVKKENGIQRETTDFVADPEISENKIIPDAAFIMENIETKKRALFFVEMDMGTERIISKILKDNRITLFHKLSQYDRYLQSLRYKKTYEHYGEFRSFTLLFVTLTDTRIHNIRQEAANLPKELAGYYRFTTFERAMGDFLSAIWLSRNPADTNRYPLVQER